MKYLKLFENHNIESICREYGIKNYTLNSDGTIDVDGDVNLHERGLTKLPIKFRNISGDFDCSSNKLTSLEVGPQSVGGHFDCDDNKLTSLEFSPKSVGGSFYCFDNPLYNVWSLISPDDKLDSSIIELFNDYDCIRDGDIIMERFNDFLIQIGKKPVDKVSGYNNI